MPVINLEAGFKGVDRTARRKDAHLGGVSVRAEDRLAVGPCHGGADCERAEIAVGGESSANLIA